MDANSITKVEGTYEIQVHTPMGVEQGTLELVLENGSLSGTITNKKGISEFTGGTVSGNEVTFNTKIKTPMGRLKASVAGVVEGNNFSGTAKLPLGSAKIEGKKIN
ncbi:MAG: hypothetical protein JXR65_04860 [Bacteroidales bacterium]|nr:hypothetical protein [Bacteroidales bacterium]